MRKNTRRTKRFITVPWIFPRYRDNNNNNNNDNNDNIIIALPRGRESSLLNWSNFIFTRYVCARRVSGGKQI